MVLGIIIVLFMGNLVPMTEPFDSKEQCMKSVVEALANVESSSKGHAKVLIAECREV